MANTALQRITQSLLTNKSGGALAQGDVVIISTGTAAAFTTTTTSGYVNGAIGVIVEPNGIANDAIGMVAFSGPVPKINLSGSASLGDLFKTHTVAGQAVRHAAGIQAGDFGIVTATGTSPTAILWGLPAGAIGAGTGDVSYAVIQAAQLCNEIKGWTPIVPPDADLVTLNLWWDDVATPTTKATVVDVGGEAGITETWELALKCVGDGAGDGLMQRYTYADEPRLKSGRVASAILAIWSVSSVSVTAKLVNSDASETAASAVTAAAWTIVTIENHTLAGTYCDLQVTAGAAGTFYVVPLGLNIGAKAFPLRPRGSVYIDKRTNVVNSVDPGGADWTDVDCTAATSNLAHTLQLCIAYSTNGAIGKRPLLRRNGSSDAGGTGNVAQYTQVISNTIASHMRMPCDDGQIFEYKTGELAALGESLSIDVEGWWEWE